MESDIEEPAVRSDARIDDKRILNAAFSEVAAVSAVNREAHPQDARDNPDYATELCQAPTEDDCAEWGNVTAEAGADADYKRNREQSAYEKKDPLLAHIDEQQAQNRERIGDRPKRDRPAPRGAFGQKVHGERQKVRVFALHVELYRRIRAWLLPC
ncbi:MAG: hypothetical protein HZB38_07555 [Planctomycetes bacterium]|nr:hypothetical protein [Planctomycetota bacterium]